MDLTRSDRYQWGGTTATDLDEFHAGLMSELMFDAMYGSWSLLYRRRHSQSPSDQDQQHHHHQQQRQVTQAIDRDAERFLESDRILARMNIPQIQPAAVIPQVQGALTIPAGSTKVYFYSDGQRGNQLTWTQPGDRGPTVLDDYSQVTTINGMSVGDFKYAMLFSDGCVVDPAAASRSSTVSNPAPQPSTPAPHPLFDRLDAAYRQVDQARREVAGARTRLEHLFDPIRGAASGRPTAPHSMMTMMAPSSHPLANIRQAKPVPLDNDNPSAKACVICMDNQASIVLVPCGHKGCCPVCVRKLDPLLCPQCRKPIQTAAHVYE